MVKVLYKLFLSVMIALFIGFGISVFYPGPKAPEYPTGLEKKMDSQLSEQDRITQEEFDQKTKTYQTEFSKHSRNVSAIAIAFSVLLLILSLTLLSNVELLSDSTLLGGLFTLAYGIIRGLISNDNKYIFLVVTIGLCIALILGYIKFIKPEKHFKN